MNENMLSYDYKFVRNHSLLIYNKLIKSPTRKQKKNMVKIICAIREAQWSNVATRTYARVQSFLFKENKYNPFNINTQTHFTLCFFMRGKKHRLNIHVLKLVYITSTILSCVQTSHEITFNNDNVSFLNRCLSCVRSCNWNPLI